MICTYTIPSQKEKLKNLLPAVVPIIPHPEDDMVEAAAENSKNIRGKRGDLWLSLFFCKNRKMIGSAIIYLSLN